MPPRPSTLSCLGVNPPERLSASGQADFSRLASKRSAFPMLYEIGIFDPVNFATSKRKI